MDEEIKAFAVLLKMLNGFANNYNQTVHKLHTLNNDAEIKRWLMEAEITFLKMQEGIEEIKLFMKKNTEK